MNEIASRWLANPLWEQSFDESDRLVVESLVRRITVSDVELQLSNGEDSFLLALLLLARATRLEHVALTLDANALLSHLHELNQDAERHGDAVRRAFEQRPHPLAALVEWIELDEPVFPSGPAVVVATAMGVPAYAYFRRLAYAEWRLTSALVESQNEVMHDPTGLFDAAARSLSESSGRDVARRMAQHRISVVTGGPGTGKTTTVSTVLHALAEEARTRGLTLSVALAAPTAKAAVRLREAVSKSLNVTGESPLNFDVRGGSLHRLLGLRPDRAVSDQPLEHDLIVVDEVSMSELTMLDQLLSRASSRTRVVLVGDAHQLASVNVGAALRDIVEAADAGALGDLVTRLTHNWRSESAIAQLAAALNAGDIAAVAAVTAANGDRVQIAASRDVAEIVAVEHALALRESAVRGDAASAIGALSEFVVLAATRRGDGSVQWWNNRLEPQLRRLDESGGRFALGAPVLITRNEHGDASDALANGDLGVQISDGAPVVVFSGPTGPRRRLSEQLGEAEVAWAMTIHKSQGSEYDEVIVSLPSHDVAILTRELLYTAVTRARHRVSILATLETIERVLARRIERVSGLAARAAAQQR